MITLTSNYFRSVRRRRNLRVPLHSSRRELCPGAFVSSIRLTVRPQSVNLSSSPARVSSPVSLSYIVAHGVLRFCSSHAAPLSFLLPLYLSSAVAPHLPLPPHSPLPAPRRPAGPLPLPFPSMVERVGCWACAVAGCAGAGVHRSLAERALCARRGAHRARSRGGARGAGPDRQRRG
jgi:hypothetical protein